MVLRTHQYFSVPGLTCHCPSTSTCQSEPPPTPLVVVVLVPAPAPLVPGPVELLDDPPGALTPVEQPKTATAAKISARTRRFYQLTKPFVLLSCSSRSFSMLASEFSTESRSICTMAVGELDLSAS
jgi:hypothetical protein